MATIGTVEGILKLRDEFSTQMQRASGNLKRIGSQMQQTGAQFSAAGAQMTKAITLPLTIIGVGSVKAFGNFDDAMTKSVAIMSDVSDEIRKDMEEVARTTAKEFVPSAEQAAESFFFLASAGLDAAASMAALPKVAAFAQAGAFDMAQATDLLTDAQSALGLTIRDDVIKNMENMVRISDVLVKANTLANASVEQFSRALTREAGAALRSFNIDVEEGVAVLAAFADQGVKGEIAGTSLSRILRLMTAAAVKNKEAYEELNIEVFDSQGNINNLADIVGDLENALGGMSDETRTAALDTLGFRARVQGVILPLLGTSDAIRRYEKELRNAGGTTQEVADKQLESLNNQMKLVKDSFIDAAITLGEGLAPSLLEFTSNVVVPFIAKLSELATAFGEQPAAVRNLVIALAALLAAAGPVLLIFGQLLITFGAITLLLPNFAAGLVAVLGPLGLIAAAAAGVVVVVQSLIELQNQLAATTLANVAGTQEYAVKINALRVELIEAREEQRGLNQELVESVGKGLVPLGQTLDQAKAKLAQLKEEAKATAVAMGSDSELGGAVRTANEKVREQEGLVANLQTQWSAAQVLLRKAADEGFVPLKESIDAVSGAGGGGGGLQGLSEEAETLRENLQNDLVQTQALAAAQFEGADAVRELEIEYEALNVVLGAGVSAEEAAAAGLIDLAKSAITAADDLADVQNNMVDLTLGVEQASSAFTDNSAQIEANARGYEVLMRATKDVDRSIADLVDINRDLRAAFANGEISADQFKEALKRVNDTTEESQTTFRDWGESFANAIADAIINADNFGDALKDLFLGQAKQSLTQFVTDFTSGMGEAAEAGKGGFASMKEAGKSAFDNLAGGTDAVSVAFAAATGEWEGLAVGAMTAISKFASGDWVGAMIAAIGVVIGAFKKLFGGGKSLAEEIDDAFKALADGVVTMEKVGDAGDILVKTFTRVAAGQNTVAGGSKVLADNFEAFFDAAVAMGDAGLASITAVVNAAREAGVDMTVIQEKLDETLAKAEQAAADRTKFIEEQSRAILSSVESLFSGVGRVTRREVRFAATSVLQAFESMRVAGLPLTQILAEIGGAVGLVGDRAEELGLKLPQAFERFGEVLEILGTQKITKVLGKVEALGATVQAVGNLGLLTAGQFDTFGDKVDKAFDKLTNQGLTSKEALAALAPQLQQLNDLQEQYGFEVDNATQKLLDQAIAQGVVTEKGLTTESILIKGFDRMIETLNAVVEALGGIPVVFDEWMETSAETTDAVVTDIETAADAGEQAMIDIADSAVTAAAQTQTAWSSSLNSLPATANSVANQIANQLSGIPISFNVSTNGGPSGEVLSAQHGTGGFMNFGSGTPAVLHGNEQVVTAAEGVGIAEMVMDAISRGRGGGGGEVGEVANVEATKEVSEGISELTRVVERWQADTIARTGAGTDRRWRQPSGKTS